MNALETIERAAVRITGVFYPSKEPLTLVFDVPRPLRHDASIRAAQAALRLERIGEHEQGFVTSYGRFVDRNEGGRIAFRAGQVDRELRCLDSESVW